MKKKNKKRQRHLELFENNRIPQNKVLLCCKMLKIILNKINSDTCMAEEESTYPEMK